MLAKAALCAEFLEILYASPKALHDTYTCCMYRGNSESDFLCEERDEECAQEYNDRVTIYFCITASLGTAWLLLCIVRCVRVRRRE